MISKSSNKFDQTWGPPFSRERRSNANPHYLCDQLHREWGPVREMDGRHFSHSSSPSFPQKEISRCHQSRFGSEGRVIGWTGAVYLQRRIYSKLQSCDNDVGPRALACIFTTGRVRMGRPFPLTFRKMEQCNLFSFWVGDGGGDFRGVPEL